MKKLSVLALSVMLTLGLGSSSVYAHGGKKSECTGSSKACCKKGAKASKECHMNDGASKASDKKAGEETATTKEQKKSN